MLEKYSNISKTWCHIFYCKTICSFLYWWICSDRT